MNAKKKQARVSFAALNPYIESNIVTAKEADSRKGYISWGDANAYPDYLNALYNGSPTLRSVIKGSIDFVLGNAQTLAIDKSKLNKKGMRVRAVIEALAEDYFVTGGFAIQVIRAKDGSIAEIYPCLMRYLRTNKEADTFYYSEEWDKSRQKVIRYPAFMPEIAESWKVMTPEEKEAHAVSILYVSRDRGQVYPSPIYVAAIEAAETEKCIGQFHLNGICNGFSASAIVNFNNGIPSSDEMEEVEKTFNEKFSGSPNAGRIVFSWNDNKDCATTIEVPKVEDFGEKYEAAAKSTRQQIFTAFRATPTIFGIPTDNNGFSNDDYDGAFKLYNRTCIRPVQDIICDAFETIYNIPKVLTFEPFTLDGMGEKQVQ